MNSVTVAVAAIAALGLHPAAGSILFSDDFSSSGTAGGHRLWASDADNANWQGSYDTAWGAASLWTMSGTGDARALTNPVTETTTTDALQRANEKPITYLASISTTDTSLDQITFSFDYSVGTGTTLYFHAAGMQNLAGKPPYTVGGSPADPQVFSTHSHSGAVTHGVHMDENFADISLFDGSHFSGSAGSAQSVTGTGTYTMTFDMSGYSITNAADLDFIAVAFGIESGNTDGSGAVSIDNFSISASAAAIPEASEALVVLLGMTGLVASRRRKR